MQRWRVGNVQRIVAAVHRTRLRLLPPGATPPTFEDSVFVALVVTFALIGETIIGDGMRANLGLSQDQVDDPDAPLFAAVSSAGFQARLAAMVRTWIERPPD